MISQDKDWQGKTERMGPVDQVHQDGTGRFRLLDAKFMDVYTGRVISRDEAELRLERTARTNGADFRPPCQYRPPHVETYLQELQAKGKTPSFYPFLRQTDK